MKRFLLIAFALLLVAAVVAITAGWLLFRHFATPQDASFLALPVYTTAQTPSAHAGYRHTALTCGSKIYVSDYEESGLQLVNSDFTNAIGRFQVSDAKICAIPGQPPSAYVAGDCGSEMPAYVPYRNLKQPPFYWRTADFREMTYWRHNYRNPYLTTTNAALIAEVLRQLRDGAPVELPPLPFTGTTNLASLKMTCDQLPGMLFCPSVYTDPRGQIYLAESLIMDFHPSKPQLRARWIAASPMLTDWMKSP